ncbi:hypothetical protein O0881_05020 [Janthinobacterium sp. SUN100]|uniref:hypothetical protein n=1 Tax=Janthinobacterium sp. SUN100 TaxID=3004101 RepID=UPI0025B23713|nr:hypothetical protein [Janthinobacterium sp. SUN100]MDN2701359.1 hypothetical protein [Janthinobacterium sp. SUN100]
MKHDVLLWKDNIASIIRSTAAPIKAKYCRKYSKIVILLPRAAAIAPRRQRKRAALAYNSGFDFTIEDQNIMEAERINIISALLNDLTVREAELRRYL